MEVIIEAHVSKVWIEVLLLVVYRYWMRSVDKKIPILSLAWNKPRGNHVKEFLAEERIMVTEGIFPLQFVPAM